MKFLAIVLALATCQLLASAQSEVDIEREAGLLLGNEKLFIPFCVSSHDYVINDIKQRANEQSSIMFKIFFGAANEIADEVITAEKSAVESLAKQIQNPEQEISDAPLPEERIQALVEEGKREIQSQGNAIGRMFAATKAASQVLFNTANSALFVRLAKARAEIQGSSLLKGILNTCNQVNEYEIKLEADLEGAKKAIKAENSQPEVQRFVDSMTVPTLKCTTPKFIARLNAFCEIFKHGRAPFMKMLGLHPKSLTTAVPESESELDSESDSEPELGSNEIV